MANEGDALVAGNICQTPSYMSGLGKEVVQKEFQKQIDVFVKNDVDFLLGEVILNARHTHVNCTTSILAIDQKSLGIGIGSLNRRLCSRADYEKNPC